MQGICRSSWTLCLYEIENEVIKFRCEKESFMHYKRCCMNDFLYRMKRNLYDNSCFILTFAAEFKQ